MNWKLKETIPIPPDCSFFNEPPFLENESTKVRHWMLSDVILSKLDMLDDRDREKVLSNFSVKHINE